MFEKFPRAPLATFLWIMRMRRMPTETEFELILQSIKEGVDFFLDLSHEIAGLTVSENSKDTSKVELISDVEMRFLSKRKKELSDDRGNGKKRSRGNEQDGTNSTHQAELASLTCRKFENLTIDEKPNNICYINSVLNGLLALDLYREKLNEGSCQCPLCIFLISAELDAINLRIWASQVNPTFSVHGRHEDAEEFLRVLIDNCASLSNLAHFNTKQKHTCIVCGKVSGSEELNRDVKSCQINIENEHENIAEMIERTNPVDKFCSCKTMQSKDGVSHRIIESYTRLPQIHFVSANRFNNNREKIIKPIQPSPIIEIDDITY